ncbi:non-canonical purine NTP pyrophosphatase [Candidatus Uhrbacteria bacterium]|nr:non-canonical purine NTP pyrophosphatase [Candidatus Uhrbacteria bacterium]
MELLIASANPGKIEELRGLLAGVPVTLRTLQEFPELPDFPESEPTFEANAIGKARYSAERIGLPTIADDGGLEIDALGGWPGVHSRRIFGDGRRGTDEELIAEVLRRMVDLPPDQRGAHMRTVLAVVVGQEVIATATGVARGTIAAVPTERRFPGYPFRSLFVPDGSADVGSMGHRRAAMQDLLPTLKNWIARQQLGA